MHRHLLLLLLFMALPVAASGISVHYGDTAITIDGATPRTSLAVIGYGRYVDPDRMERRNEIEKVLIADDAGHARLEIPHATIQMIFLVVDMTTGTTTVSSPPSYQPNRIMVPPDGLSKNDDAILTGSFNTVAWLIRPGTGVWKARAYRSGRGDENPHRSARTKIGFAHFTSLNASPAAPGHLQDGDVVMAVNPDNLQFWILTQGRAGTTEQRDAK